MKTVYNISNADPIIAYENPLEGGYIIPADAVDIEPPSYNKDTHNCSFNGNSWMVSEKPEPPKPYPTPPNLMDVLRSIRDGLLYQTDWRMTSDYQGADVEDWKAYRQQLRDVPANNPNPTWDEDTGELGNVNWPTEPENE